jgi:hypothetical protein
MRPRVRRNGPTVWSLQAGIEPAAASAGIVADSTGGRLFDFFLGLIADSGTGRAADSGTDDHAGRSGDGPDGSPGGRATKSAGPGSGFVITLGRLTRDGTRDATDGATDDRTGGSADSHPDGRAAEDAGAGADRLIAHLFVLGRRAAVGVAGGGVVERVVVGVGLLSSGLVGSVHEGPPFVAMPAVRRSVDVR